MLTQDEINQDYDGEWRNLPNVDETEAKSRYYVERFKLYAWSSRENRHIDGDIVVASWDPNEIPELFYWEEAESRGPVTVENTTCSSGEMLKNAAVMLGNKRWGSVIECEAGPALIGESTSKPAIVLMEDGGDTHVIVEETSTQPSFLYSVWKAAGDWASSAASDSNVELEYSFHVASAVRLAEAVVTGIVNGEDSGGGCFGLLRTFSTGSDTWTSPSGYPTQKASPFGEDPQYSEVDNVADVEAIPVGVVMNMNALLAFAWLMVLSAVGIVWSICLRSSIGMDIYDRCEFEMKLVCVGEVLIPCRRSAVANRPPVLCFFLFRLGSPCAQTDPGANEL